MPCSLFADTNLIIVIIEDKSSNVQECKTRHNLLYMKELCGDLISVRVAKSMYCDVYELGI